MMAFNIKNFKMRNTYLMLSKRERVGHLIRVPASNYFFALSHFRKISTANLFLSLTKRFTFLYSFTTLDFRNKLSQPYLQNFYLSITTIHTDYEKDYSQ